MKNMRIPLLVVLSVAIMGIVFGTFFDLNISSAIASTNNYFALTVSAVGPTIGFGAVAVMGGGFIAYALKGKYHIALKILFFVLAAACFGVSIFYPAGEWFGINGFYGAAPEWVGYLVVILPEAAFGVGGYFLFRNSKNENMWIVFCIIIVLLLIGLLAVIPTIKDNMHRPRYRLISTTDAVKFHKWFEPFKDYKQYLEEPYKYAKDNFKSFPSGHTAEASILLVAATFFPLANERIKKYQMPIFYGSCALVLLVAFARILAAAHFLSDVSMGATIITVLLFIANEVVMRIKPLQLKEQEPENEQ